MYAKGAYPSVGGARGVLMLTHFSGFFPKCLSRVCTVFSQIFVVCKVIFVVIMLVISSRLEAGASSGVECFALSITPENRRVSTAPIWLHTGWSGRFALSRVRNRFPPPCLLCWGSRPGGTLSGRDDWVGLLSPGRFNLRRTSLSAIPHHIPKLEKLEEFLERDCQNILLIEEALDRAKNDRNTQILDLIDAYQDCLEKNPSMTHLCRLSQLSHRSVYRIIKKGVNRNPYIPRGRVSQRQNEG